MKKKILCIVLVILFSGCAAVYAGDKNIKEGPGAMSWIMLTMDAVLAGVAKENYEMLLDERKKVGDKGTMAAVVGAVAGAAILYTILDVTVIHAVFPIDLSYSPNKNEIKFVLNKEF